eukprot:240534_1
MNNGHIWSFGRGAEGQLGHGNNVSISKPKLIKSIKQYNINHISCGSYHCAAISANNKVFVWGNNEESQCGLGSDANKDITIPTIIDININNDKKERLLPLYTDCGEDHTLLLTSKGLLLSWGGGDSDGNVGQLGHGSKTVQHTPKIIEALRGINIVNMSTG